VKVSVALCTFNGTDFLAAQITSIFGQSRLPDEVIVSDDGSADGTVALVRTLWETLGKSHGGPEITLRTIENVRPLGVTANFEQAISMCTGDLIALCDQDDIWHPNRLEVACRVFVRRPHVMLVHANARVVGQAGQYLGYTLFDALQVSEGDVAAINEGNSLEVFTRRNLATGAATMIRRELADMSLPFPQEWVHDEWLAIMASVLGAVEVVTEPLIDYRQHAGNQIGVKRPTLSVKIRRVLEPRDERNRGIWHRSSVLLARLRSMGSAIPSDAITHLDSKVEHDRIRANLADARLARIRAVLREGRTGRYARYSSRGNADILRDLFQPAHDKNRK